MKSLKESLFDRDLVSKKLDTVSQIIFKLMQYPKGTKVTEDQWDEMMNYAEDVLCSPSKKYKLSDFKNFPEDKCLLGYNFNDLARPMIIMVVKSADSKATIICFQFKPYIDEVFGGILLNFTVGYRKILERVSFSEYNFSKKNDEELSKLLKTINTTLF